jgi:hypothetical protein
MMSCHRAHSLYNNRITGVIIRRLPTTSYIIVNFNYTTIRKTPSQKYSTSWGNSDE